MFDEKIEKEIKTIYPVSFFSMVISTIIVIIVDISFIGYLQEPLFFSIIFNIIFVVSFYFGLLSAIDRKKVMENYYLEKEETIQRVLKTRNRISKYLAFDQNGSKRLETCNAFLERLGHKDNHTDKDFQFVANIKKMFLVNNWILNVVLLGFVLSAIAFAFYNGPTKPFEDENLGIIIMVSLISGMAKLFIFFFARKGRFILNTYRNNPTDAMEYMYKNMRLICGSKITWKSPKSNHDLYMQTIQLLEEITSEEK